MLFSQNCQRAFGGAWAAGRVSWLPAGLSTERDTGGDRDTCCAASAFSSGISTASPELCSEVTENFSTWRTCSPVSKWFRCVHWVNRLTSCCCIWSCCSSLEEPIIVRLSFPSSLVAAWGGLYSHGNDQYLPFLAAIKLHWLFSFSCWIKTFQAFCYHCQSQCVRLIKTWSRIVSLFCWISFPVACSGPGILYCFTFWISLRSQRALFVQFLLVNLLLLFFFPHSSKRSWAAHGPAAGSGGPLSLFTTICQVVGQSFHLFLASTSGQGKWLTYSLCSGQICSFLWRSGLVCCHSPALFQCASPFCTDTLVIVDFSSDFIPFFLL